VAPEERGVEVEEGCDVTEDEGVEIEHEGGLVVEAPRCELG
jgi:hypothetical protein